MKYIVSLFSLTLFVYGGCPLAKAANCGDTVTSNITLTSDMNCSSGYAALEVFANNVTINLNGHTINGTSGQSGVLMTGYHNLTVINGNILGFHTGINVNQSSGLNVSDITFYELGAGISSNALNNATIENNKFIRADTGVYIRNVGAKTSSNNNSINSNEFYQSRVGISICGAQANSNTIKDNLIWKSSDYGIQLTKSDANYIAYNRVLESNVTAIRISDSSYTNIKSNTLTEGGVGLTILANANTHCLASSDTQSYKNSVTGNSVMEWNTGVQLGLGVGSSAEVFLNTLKNNKIYDSNVGINFESDAHQNDTSNAYQGTTTPIIDNGTGNSY